MASRKPCDDVPWKAQGSHSVVFRNFTRRKRVDPIITSYEMIETPKRSENGMVFTFSCSREWYEILCRALKLRYWLDLGNDNAFVVDWQDVKDNSDTFIEHIIKVAGADSEEIHSLYTITTYDTKAKVMIQGNCREDWIMQEFPKFRSVVSDVVSHGFSLREAYHRHMGKTIDFQDDELLFSDCEGEDLVAVPDLDESETTKTNPTKTNPTKIQSAKKKKPTSPRGTIKSPQRKSVCKAVKPIAVSDFKEMEERLENVEICLRDHDLSALAVDLTSLNFEEKLNHIKSDIDIKLSTISSEVKHDLQSFQGQYHGLRDELLNVVKDSLEVSVKEIIGNQLVSLRDEFMEYVSVIKQDVEDFKAQVKNDLVVMRQSRQDYLDASQLTKNKEKDDIKKLQAKTDSLTDKFQHSSQQLKDLQTQITVLETSNTDLMNKIESLEKRIDVTESSFHCEPAATNDSSTAEPPFTPNEGTSEHTNSHEEVKNNPAEIVILMDSNRKFIDPKRLSGNKKATILKCGNINSTKSIISESRLKDPQILVFNIGVNDVESTDDAATIANKLSEVISISKSQFPTAKIVVSEITPRSDELNSKVQEANSHLQSALENVENVYLVSHGNIKEKNCFYDAKHLSRTVGIPKLASNIIRGIKLANGFTPTANRRNPKRQPREHKNQRQPDDSEKTPPPSPQPSSYQDDNLNIMKGVLQQLQVNGSLLSSLASSRQFIQGPGTPAFPQAVYPFRQPVQAVY